MSENLDLVRSIYADWERGDYSSAEWAHPNIVLIVADGPSPGRWEGLPAMAACWRDLFSVWEDLRAVAEEYRALAGERVLVLDHRTGHGKTSGVELAEMATQGGTVWHMREGKVTRLVIYYDRERALADLGLEEQAMSHENVEIVRGIARAVNDGDVDYVIGHTTEDVVIVAARSAVVGPFVGHDGVRKFFADNRQNFEVFQIHSDDVRWIGDDQILSIGTVHVRGRGGGVETEIPFAGVTTVRDGRASRWEDFRERPLALKAVGLEE